MLQLDKMRTAELFSGTKSFSKVAIDEGHIIFTIDDDVALDPQLCIDILKWDYMSDEYMHQLDILWASPPCTAFSVASMGHHWHKRGYGFVPKTEDAVIGLALLDKTIEIISKTQPRYWYIENPRGVMRKLIDSLFIKYGIRPYKRVTVTYCRYGDKRMKPTDIWTNHIDWYPKKMCKNNDKCHEASPRGSQTGTAGLKNAKERGRIPPALFEEIFKNVKP